jgi:RNA polymerase sigma-70 factor (ECF subfamily)
VTTTPADDEVDHLARYRDGDRTAFRDLADQYQQRVRLFFFRQCWDRHLADDLAQELFVRLLQISSRYRPEGKLSTFVLRIATNIWIDHWRTQRVRHRRAGPLDGAHPGLCSTERAPADDAERAEESASLRAALRQLGEHYRLVVELAVNQGLPYAQIGELLGIPVGTVKSRMHNAIAALRKLVAARPTALRLVEDRRGRKRADHG